MITLQKTNYRIGCELMMIAQWKQIKSVNIGHLREPLIGLERVCLSRSHLTTLLVNNAMIRVQHRLCNKIQLYIQKLKKTMIIFILFVPHLPNRPRGFHSRGFFLYASASFLYRAFHGNRHLYHTFCVSYRGLRNRDHDHHEISSYPCRDLPSF